MKLLTEENKYATNISSEDHGRFKVADALIVQQILSSLLYSDTVLACVREYSVNCVESNRDAGHNHPIKVHLPTIHECYFSVEDDGIGMSRETLENIFCVYGISTKRNSNNNEGMYGIGSKSGYSYGSGFTVETVKDGEKNVLVCSMDNHSRFCYDFLESTYTDLPNGVKVTIPVKSHDISAFEVAAKKVYKHFNIKPEFIGKQLEFDNEVPEYKGNGWRIIKGTYYEDSYLVMGVIGYKIDRNQFSGETFNLLSNCRLEIDCPIGDCTITPDREKLKYTPATKDYINSAAQRIIKELREQVEGKAKNCKSVWEFRVFLNTLGYISNIVGNNFTFKGEKVSIWPTLTEKYSIREYKNGSERRTRIDIYPAKNVKFAVRNSTTAFVRSKQYAQTNKICLYLLDTGEQINKKILRKFCKDVGIRQKDLLFTNDFPKVTQTRTYNGTTKTNTEADVYTPNKYYKSWESVNRFWSNAKTIDLSTHKPAYFVPIKHYLIGGTIEPYPVRDLFDKYELYAVLERSVKKFESYKWKNIKTLIKDELDRLAKNPAVSKYNTQHFTNGTKWVTYLTGGLSKFNKKHYLYEAITNAKEFKDNEADIRLFHQLINVYKSLGESYTITYNYYEPNVSKSVYPLLDYINEHLYGDEAVLNYILKEKV